MAQAKSRQSMTVGQMLDLDKRFSLAEKEGRLRVLATGMNGTHTHCLVENDDSSIGCNYGGCNFQAEILELQT